MIDVIQNANGQSVNVVISPVYLLVTKIMKIMKNTDRQQ